MTGIAAKNMNKVFTVKVTKGGEGDLSVTYSVLTYLYNMQNNNRVGDLCKTMYDYHVKAKAYFS